MIARMAPEQCTASAQGIYVMVSGVRLAVVTMAAGPLYQAYGIAAFWFMIPAAVAVAGLVALLAFRRRMVL